MRYRIKDLSPDRQQASRALDAAAIVPSRLPPDDRIAALQSLNDRLAGNLTDTSEEDEAVAEAIRSVRPGYRPLD